MTRENVMAEFERLCRFKDGNEYKIEDTIFSLYKDKLHIFSGDGLLMQFWYENIHDVRVHEKDNFYLDEYTEQYKGTDVAIIIENATGDKFSYLFSYINEDRF